MNFKKADKKQSKLRLSIFGPSGAGKTMTSLKIANGFLKTGLKSRVAFIDTERGSANKYADQFDFDILELDKKSILDYIQAIKLASEHNYQILIIDSLSHAWQELIEDIDRLANVKYKGNTWRAWSEGTPKQRSLIDAIISYPGHVISTIRSKTEWEVGDDKKVRRVGLSPEQGKGIEYEFDMLMEISVDHYATIIKDRTGKYQDKIINKPDEKFGEELIAWLNVGNINNIEVVQSQKPTEKKYSNQSLINGFVSKFEGYVKARDEYNIIHSCQKIAEYKTQLNGDWSAIKAHVYDVLLPYRTEQSYTADNFKVLAKACDIIEIDDLAKDFRFIEAAI